MMYGDDAGAFERARRRAIWTWMGLVWAVAALGGWLLGRAWIEREVRVQAERQGVALAGCELELGWASFELHGCSFNLPVATATGRGLAPLGVAASGRIERVGVDFSGFAVSQIRVHGLTGAVQGVPRLIELLGRATDAAELPILVEQSSLSWDFDSTPPVELELSNLSYSAATRQLSTSIDIAGRDQGRLVAGPEGVEVTLGDAARPRVRVLARTLPVAGRAEFTIELHRLPLRELEGPWLILTEALRSVELEGRIAISIPFGLTVEAPVGDLYLTLAGLQFPVPRELMGLVHGSPPKIAAKFKLSRLLDRVTFQELSFLTGALAMRGDGSLNLEQGGLGFQVSLSGPLACSAIAESAASAHADSLLASWAGRVAKRALKGSVQIVAALHGKTPRLADSTVVTSIGVGCGLKPLPLDARLPSELLERLPEDLLRQFPGLEGLPALGEVSGTKRASGALKVPASSRGERASRARAPSSPH